MYLWVYNIALHQNELKSLDFPFLSLATIFVEEVANICLETYFDKSALRKINFYPFGIIIQT